MCACERQHAQARAGNCSFLQRPFKENSSFHNSLLEKLFEGITSPSNLESMKNLIFSPYSLLKASQSTLSLWAEAVGKQILLLWLCYILHYYTSVYEVKLMSHFCPTLLTLIINVIAIKAQFLGRKEITKKNSYCTAGTAYESYSFMQPFKCMKSLIGFY